MRMEKNYLLESYSKKENKSESEKENPNRIDFSQHYCNSTDIFFCWVRGKISKINKLYKNIN